MPRCGRLAGATRNRSTSSKRMLPAVGRSVPEMVLNSVVLPAPFGPTIETNWPASTAIDTPCSTGTAE